MRIKCILICLVLCFQSLNVHSKNKDITKMSMAELFVKLETLQASGKLPESLDISSLKTKSLNKYIDPRFYVVLAIIVQLILWWIKLNEIIGSKYNMLKSQNDSYLNAVKMEMEVQSNYFYDIANKELSNLNMGPLPGKVVNVNGHRLKIGGVGASTCLRSSHDTAMREVYTNTKPLVSEMVTYLDMQLATEQPEQTDKEAESLLYADNEGSVNPLIDKIKYSEQEKLMYSIKKVCFSKHYSKLSSDKLRKL